MKQGQDTPSSIRAGLDPSADFQRALALIESGDEHVFVTGRAGTGKTTLLHLLREETLRNVAVVAPTGLAAINVSGQTAGPSVAHLMEHSLPKLLDTASRVSALVRVQQ